MGMPAVSVFMTVRDEERDLADCVARILAQDYDGDLELVVAVGPSHDRTREIADALAADEPRLTVVDNPTGLTPHGLNAAVSAAKHDYLVRADGHALYPSDYVARVVAELERTGAANVGGRMEPVGHGPFGRAVARAMSSRFGIGGAAFHVGGDPGPQPTVYLGAFRRSAFKAVGGYDEYFVRAQDWELNLRLRQAGETVWFLPDLAVVYHPRETWRDFARQQYKTGQWRRKVIRRYPQTASVRYLAPPAAAVATGAGLVVGAVGLVTGGWPLLGFVAPAAYGLGVLAVSAVEGRDLDAAARVRLPLAIGTLHLTWGAGFLRG
ncbi:glycosyl transferase family 2 [Mumia flava]|uniref:Glycosyl transferase family 2 n=1 Tax=Mumia flava TaxID=1348852 RepID=A0A0B2B6C2_9ACTN|nr:glycosyltransferase family 2 protein [Mumia flava]PJJ53937.1 glycosyl transferase family 2 [Mumia flava]